MPDSTAIPTKVSDLTNDSGFITTSDIPTNVSDFNNDAGYLTSFTETDPTVPSWAKQPNKPSYDYSEINNTPDLSGFITKSVNDLTNYYLKSETYTKAEVADLIGAIQQFHYEIYPALPKRGESNVLYLIGPTGSGRDKYEEYVYSKGAFTKIGDTSIDLSGYVTTSALNTALAGYCPMFVNEGDNYIGDWEEGCQYIIGADGLIYAIGDANAGGAEDVVLATTDYVNNTIGDLATVATSGDYDDLINKPIIPNVSGKEDTSNKVTSFQSTPDDTHYPSEKLVKDSLDTKIDNTDVEALTAIDVDNTPTANSSNLVTSGGVYDYINPLLYKWGVVNQTLTWDTTNAEYIISNITQGIIPQYFIDLVTAEGAIFNTNSGYFELNGITDIAYDEMKIIYSSRTANGMNNVLPVFGKNYTARTNFAVFRGGAVSYPNHQGTVVFSKYLAYKNASIINFAITDRSYYYASGANNNFESWGAASLPEHHNRIKKIIGTFNVTNLTGTTQFFYENTFLPQLEEFDMRDIVSTRISWGGMPKLKVETIANSVKYASNSAASTWTIHADAYTRCQADTTEYTYNGNTYTGVLAYASAKNITIASA